ncbi:MAG TPA: hypothetical protein VJA82_09580 [Sediminibacterium sp.]|uniref:hypothetical protein n=1 Tax=Sediminibacterium sp. TaxID=1917865 RepID=UPI0008B0AA74|nr:hypothetical protein [Sediminibacterium sp.]OHC85263.1 MAG: hypothetical protein A2472_05665 [Sphingobacteriia bacterium RIFOXYC2_FULL_35_18]OHC89166.1 MAG: hypothetical protein A2546_07705 [Sphingobacteriia bacterium RIFOXYD2_FULL_35_12]HLD53544.1 hypothetical protein [Sediminibacterium sp.]
MRQKLAFESMKMGNPSSTKGAAGDLGKPPYLEVGAAERADNLSLRLGAAERADNQFLNGFYKDLLSIH